MFPISVLPVHFLPHWTDKMSSRDFPAKPAAANDPPTADGRSSLDTHVGKPCNFYLICSIPSMTSVARGGAACPSTARSLRARRRSISSSPRPTTDGTAIVRDVLVARAERAGHEVF